MFVSYSLSLSKFVSIGLVQQRAVANPIKSNRKFCGNVSNQKCLFLTLSLSLQFCLYRSSLIESSRKFYRNVYNPKCLFPSQNTDSLNKTCPTRNVCSTLPLSLYLTHSLSLTHYLSLSNFVCLVL